MSVRKSRLRKFLDSKQEELYLFFAQGHTYNGKTVDEIPKHRLVKNNL